MTIARSPARPGHAVSARDDRLDELIALTLELGEPARDLAILAEGNTSVRIDEESFWVKTSGTAMARAGRRSDYVAVALRPLMETLREPEMLDDATGKQRLASAALSGGRDGKSPSIETYVHAACLEVAGATFVTYCCSTTVCLRWAPAARRPGPSPRWS
jgi:rhamnose utilization protein RhaD (predicted bifunctional aldolase and dehydrogenase)